MPQGVQIFNNGSLLVDYTTPVGKLLGSFQTNGNQTGQAWDGRITQGTLFYFGFGQGLYPTVTANGEIMNWSYQWQVTGSDVAPGPSDMMHTIFYGIY